MKYTRISSFLKLLSAIVLWSCSISLRNDDCNNCMKPSGATNFFHCFYKYLTLNRSSSITSYPLPSISIYMINYFIAMRADVLQMPVNKRRNIVHKDFKLNKISAQLLLMYNIYVHLLLGVSQLNGSACPYWMIPIIWYLWLHLQLWSLYSWHVQWKPMLL